LRCRVAFAPAEPRAQLVVTSAPLAARHVRGARLSPGTSVLSHDRVQYSRACSWPDQAANAVLPALCS
jgi:hypothetical protein